MSWRDISWGSSPDIVLKTHNTYRKFRSLFARHYKLNYENQKASNEDRQIDIIASLPVPHPKHWKNNSPPVRRSHLWSALQIATPSIGIRSTAPVRIVDSPEKYITVHCYVAKPMSVRSDHPVSWRNDYIIDWLYAGIVRLLLVDGSQLLWYFEARCRCLCGTHWEPVRFLSVFFSLCQESISWCKLQLENRKCCTSFFKWSLSEVH